MKKVGLARYTGRFAILLAGRFMGALALFAVNLLIVDFLSVDALADYAVFVSTVSLLGTSLFLGFSSIAPVFAAEYNKTSQTGLLKGFLQQAAKTGAVTLAIMLLVLLVVGYSFFDAADAQASSYWAMVVMTSSATAALGLNAALNVGLDRQVAGLLPETLLRPVLLLAGTSLFLGLQMINGIEGLYALTALAAWLAFSAVLIFDRPLRQHLQSVSPQTDPRRWYRASLPWLGTTLLWDYMIDIMLILSSILMNSLEIALLHICFRYRVLAGFGMRTIHTLLLPEIAGHTVARNETQMKRKIQQANLASFGYSICVLIVFAAMADWLLSLFSLDASEGVFVLLIVTSTMLVRSIFGPAPLVLAVHNLHLATMLVSFAGLALAGVWIWVSYESLGILAVAVGYTGANLLISLCLWIYAKHRTQIDTSIFAAPLRLR